jgi:competence ComEA-like helix-hairpin-helix protein
MRFRTTQIEPNDDGKPCPHLNEARTCSENPCPVDCIQGDWSGFSACSKSCGAGLMTRERKVLRTAMYGGKRCGTANEERTCVKACPVDCAMGEWGGWKACSRSCGTGTQQRTRAAITEARHGGALCGTTFQQQTCEGSHCPVDCIMDPWGSYTPCSVTCGFGEKIRTRGVLRESQAGGKTCNAKQEMKRCHVTHCPVHCKYSDWSPLSACSVTCGADGTQSQFRTILEDARNGGKACKEKLVDTQTCNGGACPVHCEVSEWGSWGACSKTCFNGRHGRSPDAPVQFRSRTKLTQVPVTGAACPDLRESQGCNYGILCVEDCQMGGWGGWSTCTRECGGGSQSRSRDLVSEQVNGGKVCGPTWDVQSCNKQACPVDCRYGDWTEWSSCSKECGGGFATRTRGKDIEGKHGGKPCETSLLTSTKSCNLQGCPVDCSMGEWTSFPKCSAACGVGTQRQTRRVITPNAHGGKACGATEHISACNVAPCPVDCKMSDFGEWSTCTRDCGGGTQSRARSVERADEHGGRPCPKHVQTRSCQEQLCPTNCALGDWSEWTNCDKSCGPGVRHATRGIMVHDANGGTECPAADSAERAKTLACDTGACPRACVMTPWGTWSTCSNGKTGKKACGAGSTQRARTVHLIGIQSACPHDMEKKPCQLTPCPIDCSMTALSGFTACSASCGGGTKTASRRITFEAKHGGKACQPKTVTKNCKTAECPIDAEFTTWGTWGDCSFECGGGTQSRTRSEEVADAFGGKGGDIEETRPCNTHMCAVNCVLGSWGAWTSCSKSCGGGGVERRFRGIELAAQHGGTCDGDTTATRTCGDVACPIDCVLGAWTQMSACSKTCGSGTRTRKRFVTTKAENGGRACPGTLVESTDWRDGKTKQAIVQRYVCHAGVCPVHCVVSAWATWQGCSRSCGGGTMRRTRTVTTVNRAGGYACPSLVAESGCNDHECPIDCRLNSWSSWTDCDLNCGGGEQTRSRSVHTAAKWGGEACGQEQATKSCNSNVCPVDCKLSDWGVWFPATGCSKTCGGGTKYRTKAIEADAQGSGKACAEFTRKETVPCNLKACDVDCQYTQWSSWTACTKSCGTGTKDRTRIIQVQAVANGKACGSEFEQTNCGVELCPIDCVANEWGNWDACTATCGRGTKTMTRGHQVEAENGGKTCEEQNIVLEVTRSCQIKPCPVPCQLSDYSEWSTCSVSCGTGFRSKTRKILRQNAWGGAPCTGRKLQDTEPCDLGICPINCVVSEWGTFGACTSDGTSDGTVKTCGGGLKTRERTISTDVVHSTLGRGKVCPHLEDTVECADKKCPIDCVMAEWATWSTCDAACGRGSKFRRRGITTQAKHGGTACTETHETAVCNIQVCPIDCKYSPWSDMTPCSLNCGAGTQSRTRSVMQESQGSGTVCNYATGLKRARSCNVETCLSTGEKCAKIFAESAATATALGNGCFAAIKSALVAGATIQGTATGSCLWSSYTTMDIRERCPKRVVTAAEIAVDYPKCEELILKQCADPVNCRATNGVEIAQGNVWNADKAKCPPPTEYSFALDTAFAAKIPENVDINVANVAALDKLFGIGTSKAEKIIMHRSKEGTFASIQGLADVSGISTGTVERMLENCLREDVFAKPIVSNKVATGDFCTFGEQVVIDWWASKSSTVNIDDSAGVALGAAKQGALSGAYTFAKDGPWKVAFDIQNAVFGDTTDSLVATLDGTGRVLENAKAETIVQTVIEPTLSYNFKFTSSTAKFNKHMTIQNAIATCTAEPKNCKLAQWGSWGECSRECNMNQQGSGIQYREREVEKHAEFGGKCDESLSQVRRCNHEACPWQAVVEAEDGRLGGCAAFDNNVYSHEASPRTNFHGAGYVAMDSGALVDQTCLEKPSTISWQIRVPAHGRYKLKFRYAAEANVNHQAKISTMSDEQVVINYQYEENIALNGQAGDDYSTWRDAPLEVDLYKGINTITVTTSPHEADGSKPHIDRMTVKKMADLARCTPGTVVPLQWFATATPSSSTMTGTDGGAKLGAGFKGTLRGYADLGALGPWSVQFAAKGGETGDSARIMFNSVNVGNAAGGSVKKMSVPVQSASIAYKMDFEAMNAAASGHMEVLDGVAVCEGCSDVTCERVQVGNHFKIVVTHPKGSRADDGSTLGNGEQHGNNHKCEYVAAWESCQCTCDTVPLTHGAAQCGKDEYRKFSKYVTQDGTEKVATRCLTCPNGYECPSGNCDVCTGIPSFVFSQDTYNLDKEWSIHRTDGYTRGAGETFEHEHKSGVLDTGGAVDTMSTPSN